MFIKVLNFPFYLILFTIATFEYSKYSRIDKLNFRIIEHKYIHTYEINYHYLFIFDFLCFYFELLKQTSNALFCVISFVVQIFVSLGSL